MICYLRMNFTEQYYDNAMTGGCSLDVASFWERKLMGVPMVQINIVSEGGQQVVSNA